MKKLLNVRNSVIIILCVTIVFMAVGFIILSIEYTKNKKDTSYNVVFTKIKKSSSVKGSNADPKGDVKILDNASEIDMNITMNASHDELSYVATIENQSSVPIEILDIMESPDYKLDKLKEIINPVTISLSDVKGKVIEPDETLDLKIVFYYNGVSSGSKTFNYKIGLITKSK